MLVGLLVFLVIVAVLIWLVTAYNNLIAVTERVTQAWASIDALLRQRHDEIPKLIEKCAQHTKYEQATFDAVLEARAAIFAARQTQDPTALGQAESELRDRLGKLLTVAAQHPDLTADPAFVVLRQRLAVLQIDIAERREIYNDAVNLNNSTIARFPGSLVASMGGFRASDRLEFAADLDA
jgi:LemA protein